MLLKIHPDNPEPRKIKQIVEVLQNDGVIIYPTDTIYGLGCSIYSHKAMERICRIKNIDPEKANLSFICSDLSNISDFTKPISTPVFKLMKKLLPGPFTFLLNANNELPKLLKNKKKTVGIRVPNSPIVRSIVDELNAPLLSSSIKNIDMEDNFLEYPTDPQEIYEQYHHQVDLIIDGGYGGNIASTIIDCTGNSPVLNRKGLGEWLED
jgi:tRNA threonylcarbamoyl adenosine modification protein (Sua5/YciO/YrdC/YwlC family)